MKTRLLLSLLALLFAGGLQASVLDELNGNLVSLQGNALAPFDSTKLAGTKFLAVYYSASWCGPCRKFTPELVRFYKQQKANHPEFEVLFVSNDRSREDMLAYMKTDKMPWPALDFGKSISFAKAGRGIPCLVVVDETGKVLSDSFEGETYRGPQEVLKDLRRLLSKSGKSGGSGSSFDEFFKK